MLSKMLVHGWRCLAVAACVATVAVTAAAGEVSYTIEYNTTDVGQKRLSANYVDMDAVVTAIGNAVNDGDSYIADSAVVTVDLNANHTSANTTLPGPTPYWVIDPTSALGSLTINGGGNSLYATGANNNPLLRIGNVADVAFNSLTLSGVNANGAVDMFGGGADIRATGVFQYAGGTVSGNTITTTRVNGNARGGGLNVVAGSINIGNVAVTGNSTKGANAYGGGLSVESQTRTVITGGEISGNKALGTTIGRGGGLHVTGDLTLNDVVIKGNTASGDTAQGGAAYVTGTANVNLNVTAGTNTIEQNKIGSGSASSFYINHTGTDSGSFDINVNGNATLALLDPLAIVSGGTYNLSKIGEGDLNWDGINTIDAANSDVVISKGKLILGNKFSLQAINDTTMIVDIDEVEEINFGLGRRNDLALFDFGSAINNGSMDVSEGTKLTTTLGRQIKSFDEDYLVAKGLDYANAIEVANNLVLDSDTRYLSFTNPLKVDSDDSNVWANVRFHSPFDYSGVNALSARDPLHELLNGTNPVNISQGEHYAILDNARSAHPELFMEQAFVFIDGVDMVMRSARNYGLRAPHRARMRMEEAYSFGRSVPAEREHYTDYGEPIITRPAYDEQPPADQYYQPQVSAASDFAYPRLVDCAPGSFASGLRFWTGYIGEWRSVSAHSGYNGYKASRNGFLLGVNYDLGSVATLGMFAGYTRNDTKAKSANSKITSDTGHFGMQARFSPISAMRELSFFADLGYHWSNNKMHRNLGGWGAQGKFEQDGFTFGLGVEHVFNVCGFGVAPYLELRHTGVDQDDLSEGGTSVTATNVHGFDKSGTNTRLGVELSKDMTLSDGMLLAPTVNLAWRHEYGDKNFHSTANYIAGNNYLPFTMSSSPLRRDSVDIGLALRMAKQLGDARRFGANIGYNVNLASHTDTHTLYAGVEFGF